MAIPGHTRLFWAFLLFAVMTCASPAASGSPVAADVDVCGAEGCLGGAPDHIDLMQFGARVKKELTSGGGREINDVEDAELGGALGQKELASNDLDWPWGPHPPELTDEERWGSRAVEENEETEDEEGTELAALLSAGTRWGSSPLAEIYPANRRRRGVGWRQFAKSPIAKLSDSKAVVCYDDSSDQKNIGYGTCNVLSISDDVVTAKGSNFALQRNPNKFPRADGLNLWRLSATRLVTCFGGSSETSWTWYGMCKILSVSGMDLAQEEGTKTVTFEEGAKYVNLKPLPGSETKAVVCYYKWESAPTDANAGKKEARSYCRVIKVEGSDITYGVAIEVSDGDSKQFAELAALSSTTAVLCVDDGRDKTPPIHGRGASGFCLTLTINGMELAKSAPFEIYKGECQMDSVVPAGEDKAILCYSVNTGTDWGICSVLSISPEGMQKGPDMKPETCASGKGTATGLSLSPLSESKALACYTKYSKGRCVSLSVSGDALEKGVPFNVIDSGKSSDVEIAQFGPGKALACFGKGETRMDSKSGMCTMLSEGLDGVGAAAPPISAPGSGTPSPIPPTPTSPTPPADTATCEGSSTAFHSGFGGCPSYATKPNADFCSKDKDKETKALADNVCPQCGKCK